MDRLERAPRLEGPEERARLAGRIADQEHLRALRGEKPLGGLEDALLDTRGLVADQQHVLGVMALKALGRVRREPDREPVVIQLELRGHALLLEADVQPLPLDRT